jgi:FHS family Na+ dependent glucose MFS transporter 1
MSKSAKTITYFLSILSLGLFTGLTGPSLPTLANNTATTLDQLSLIFVLGSLGYLLGSFLGGRGYDRLPGHQLMAVSLGLTLLSGALIPVTHQLWWLLVAQFTLGLGQGVNDVGCNSLLLWVHGKDSRSYINGLHFFFGVGSTIAPLILAWVITLTDGIQWAYWMIALLCFPLAVWLWFLPDAPSQSKERQKESASPSVYPVVLLILAFTVYVGAEVGFGSWLYTYALQKGLATTITSAYLTSVFWGSFTLGRLFGVWFSTQKRPLIILVIDLVGCLSSVSVVLVFPNSQLALWLGTIGAGTFMASVFPSTLLLAQERLTVSGTMTGWFLVGGGLGGMILPWLIGLAFKGIGTGALPGFVLVALLLDLLLLLTFNRKTSPTLSLQ